MVFEVPLTAAPQQFQIALGATNYVLTLYWCDALEGGWVLDFSDPLTGLSIVAGIPIVTGVNLFENIAYLGFTGSMFAATDGDLAAPPTYDNLGTESHVYFEVD